MKKDNIDNPTDEQIAAWKAQYGEVYAIEVAEEPDKFEALTLAPEMDDVPRLIGYLKKPDRKIMNFAVATMPKNIINAGKAVVKDCWLGGDERLKNHEAYSSSAGLQAIELVEIYNTRLKKL